MKKAVVLKTLISASFHKGKDDRSIVYCYQSIPQGGPKLPNSLDHRCTPPYKATEAYQIPPDIRMKSTGRCCSALILCITTKVLTDLIYPQVRPEQTRIQTTDSDSLKGLSILVFSELYLLYTSIF